MAVPIPRRLATLRHDAAIRKRCKNPKMWDQNVFAWCGAASGPSGLHAYDDSGYGNDGALTNMDPETDWVMTPYGWGLDFDGGNDSVICGRADLSVADLTLLAIVKADAWAGDHRGIIVKRDSWNAADMRWQWNYNNIGNYIEFRDLGAVVSFGVYGVPPINTWLHLVVVHKYNTWTDLYVNGSLAEHKANGISYSADTAAQVVIGGLVEAVQAFNGIFVSAGAWSRILSPSEIAAMAADPLAMWTPRPVQISGYVAPTGLAVPVLGAAGIHDSVFGGQVLQGAA